MVMVVGYSSSTGLDQHARPSPTRFPPPGARRLPLLLLGMLSTILLPSLATAIAPVATTACRRLPPWVMRARGGGGGAAAAADEAVGSSGDGGPAWGLRREEFELVEEEDRYRGRWRSILKVCECASCMMIDWVSGSAAVACVCIFLPSPPVDRSTAPSPPIYTTAGGAVPRRPPRRL